VTYRIDGASYNINFDNPDSVSSGVKTIELDGVKLPDDRVELQPGSGDHVVLVVLGSPET
jgi:cellobiose phosphorylase